MSERLKRIFIGKLLNAPALDFKTIWNLSKGIYKNKDEFEMDLEYAMQEGYVRCIRVDNVNLFQLNK